MANPIISATIVTEGGVNRLDISVAGVGDLAIRMGDLTPDLATYACLHGLKQKIVDCAALERNPETGLSASPQDKFDAMRDMIEHLRSGGAWNRRPSGGSGNVGLLVEALVKVTGQDVDAIRATVAGWDDKTQAAMRSDPAVAPVIAEIKARRNAGKVSGVDTKALLANIMPAAAPKKEKKTA